MKILLVNPTIPLKCEALQYGSSQGAQALYRKLTGLVGPPLGLCDIAGMLPNENVKVLDQNQELYEAAHDLSKYNPQQRFEEILCSFVPDIVGISCVAAQANSAKKLFSIIKDVNKKIISVLGGLHPSSYLQDFLFENIDIVVLGYGKITFSRIVEEIKKNGKKADLSIIPGICIKSGNRFISTDTKNCSNINEFEENYCRFDIPPNRAVTDHHDYRHPKINARLHFITTAVGCTHRCNFCYLWKMAEKKYACKKNKMIIDELKNMDKYSLIRFCDANTFGNVKKVEKLFELIIDNGLNKHYYVGDVRAQTVSKTPRVFELAKKAGLTLVIIGLEATSDEELKLYNKDSSIKETESAMHILNDLGIHISGNYIIRPDFDERDFERVSRFVENHPIFSSQFTVLTPFPGTEQWDILKDQIINTDFDYYNLINAVIKTKLPIKKFYENLCELYNIGSQVSLCYLKSKSLNPSEQVLYS